jgi:hypothetical protein
MLKRFLLLTSGLLAVLSGPPSHVLAQAEHSHAATVSTPAIAAGGSSAARNDSLDAFDGNQDQ